MKYFQVDAFADGVFSGNPAGVVPLEAWPQDLLLQSMAGEHNLSETAFFAPDATGRADFVLRWMTPVSEVELCGHATLSAAHVLWQHLGWSREAVVFSSKSGPLAVRRDGDLYELDFPALPLAPIADSGRLSAALGMAPAEVYSGMHWACVYDSIEQIENLRPDLSELKDIEVIRAVGVTAPGRSHDFVSRLFAPRLGIDEDPVTGSLHSLIAPYWAKRLGRASLSARQISPRGGNLRCVVEGARVRIAGRAVTYLEGTIHVTR